MSLWKISCYVAAAIFLYVGAVLLVFPDTQIAFLGAPVDAGGAVMGTRSTPLYAAMALVFLTIASLEPGAIRRRFAAIATFNWGFIAVIGVHHWVQDAVGSEVFLAVAVEAIMATVFFLQIRSR